MLEFQALDRIAGRDTESSSGAQAAASHAGVDLWQTLPPAGEHWRAVGDPCCRSTCEAVACSEVGAGGQAVHLVLRGSEAGISQVYAHSPYDALSWRLIRPGSLLAVLLPPHVAAPRAGFSSRVDLLWGSMLTVLSAGERPVIHGLTEDELSRLPIALGAGKDDGPDIGPPCVTIPEEDWRLIRSSLLDKLPISAGQNGVSGVTADPIRQTALQAGILLWQDDLDGSHQRSQSIEGEGNPPLGDHWHAIMHRREPDYGNSKYWYRQVGQSPLFEGLAMAANPLLNMCSEIREKWATRLLRQGKWDAMAFVDFCQECASLPAEHPLRRLACQLQAIEMALLLEASLVR